MGAAPEADGDAHRGCNPRATVQARETDWAPLTSLPPLTVAATLRCYPDCGAPSARGGANNAWGSPWLIGVASGQLTLMGGAPAVLHLHICRWITAAWAKQ
ncbi:hypothetical protein [Aeromonas cavernicola]|uniref:Uncharacterized protein n=1 Tax=Aeromonas cavernicola TaxID=1006623 RepID=A0A2H9U3S1_9GAMM|nr:hypothetical protein [Aeromonas cavernicola]PJG58683.1 hypothetical protein CUC53_11315 [Aeromonas cavernicola]